MTTGLEVEGRARTVRIEMKPLPSRLSRAGYVSPVDDKPHPLIAPVDLMPYLDDGDGRHLRSRLGIDA